MNPNLERRFPVRERERQQGPVENRSYLNDDYNKHAGPHYRETSYQDDFNFHDDSPAEPISGLNRSRFAEPYTQGQDRYGRRELMRPGVSGKSDDDETWVNQEQYRRQRNFVGKGPRGYQRSDERIHEEVCEALSANPFVDPTNIEVGVRKGIVMLKGTTESRQMKKKIEAIVEHMPGVEDVDNCIRLSSSEHTSH